jgi:osmotically-inducible protein OsmY
LKQWEKDRMKSIRLALFALAASISLSNSLFTSCQKQPIERTSAEQQDDQKLAETVKATFANSKSFKFPDVQVAVFKGTVQLSGFVVSEDQKTAAEGLAKTVPGISSVENEISIKK